MKRITYYITVSLISLFRFIPFRALYLLSDFAYFLIFHLVGYRKKVVFSNLQNSFPEKSSEEITLIAKKFYKHLTDIILEAIKGLSMSKEELIKRYKILNPEVADQYYDKGTNVISLACHYANWEWGVMAIHLQLKHQQLGLYKPLTNKYLEEYILKKRGRFGIKLISIYETRKKFAETYQEPVSYIMAADQNPSNIQKAIWVKFLNQDTACLHGVEFYAHATNYPLLYFDMQRVKRGYYTLKILDFEPKPQTVPQGEITQKYMAQLEKIILEKPSNWLWSHRRWKHKRSN